MAIARLTARGRASTVAGWTLMLAGAICLGIEIAVGVHSTLGPHGFTYLTNPKLETAPGWMFLVVLFAPLFGFNFVYWSASPERRTPSMRWVLILATAELVALIAATYWYSGADIMPSRMFVRDAADAHPTVAAHFFLAAVVASGAVLFWLGGRSTFDEQSAEYFGPGRSTTVSTTPVRLRTNLAYSVLFFVLMLLAFVPLVPSSHRTGGEDLGRFAPWPAIYADHTYVVGALAFYTCAMGVLWGVSSSLLAKKALYAGPWKAKAGASPRKDRAPGRLVRVAVRIQHAPFIIGATLAPFIMVSPDPDQYGYWFNSGKLLGALIVLAVCAALGVLCYAQVWKARDLSSAQLRLRRPALGQPQAQPAENRTR